jgi:hypothetical protein
MSKAKVELSDIFRAAVKEPDFKATKEQWKVINAIINCRTAALGGHIYKCRECNKEQPHYNSCRNRHCPKCQGAASAKWLEARASELLDVPYFHLVFTMPHELNGLILQNKRVLLNILFQSASKALNDIAKKRLKGQIGFFSVLHTWGQKLDFHPHLHCVIPGVVLKDDNSIMKTKQNYLLPKNVASPVFRAIFIKALVKAYKAGKLKFLGEQLSLAAPSTFFKLIKTIKRKHWVVYAKKPFAGPETVLKYLARYTHKVAISNSRIIKTEKNLTTFLFKDYSKKSKKQICTLTNSEFVRRFLTHTLPHQFVRIRHAGFMANGKKTKAIKGIRDAIGDYVVKTVTALKEKPFPACSCCGASNIIKVRIISPLNGSNAHQTKILPLVA